MNRTVTVVEAPPAGSFGITFKTDPYTVGFVVPGEENKDTVYALVEEDAARLRSYFAEREQRVVMAGVEAVLDLFTPIAEYLKGLPKEVPWLVPGFLYFGGVSMLAGIWKGGKSQYAASLITARARGKPFLGRELPEGPVFLLTEEGGISLAEKYENAEGFELVDARAMAFAEVSLADVLKALEARIKARNERNAFVVVDTLSVLSGVEDENSSVEVTAAIRLLMNFAQVTGAAVLVIDHTVKTATNLNHGRSIRGSGAKPATLDVYGVLDYGPTATQRSLKTEGRVRGSRNDWLLDFDVETQVYSLLSDEAVDATQFDKWSSGFPMAGDGMSIADLMNLWECSRNTVKTRIASMLDAAPTRARREWRQVGRTHKWLYWSVLPRIDQSGVFEQGI
jgi:hypothetical protein